MGRFRRLGSFAASAAWHAVLLIVVIVAARSARGSHEPIAPPSPSSNAHIVWLNQPDPGGGGGGGGDHSPTPARLVEARGRDSISVPVAKPRVIDPPAIAPDVPKPVQEIVIPARNLASALESLPGSIEGVPAPASPSRGPGNGNGAGGGNGSADGPGDGAGLGPGRDRGTSGGSYRIGSGGVTSPVEIRRAVPQYTTAAMQARIQGAVILECVVQTTGICTNARVIRSLDDRFGLDQEAIKAAGMWRFKPGTQFGQPVPVLITMEITFTVR